jgi:hypothetical protein
MPALRSLTPFLLVGPLLGGCSATIVGTPEAADADATSVTGVVLVEQSGSSADGAHAEVSARFIKVHGAIDEGALRLVGAALDVPPVGECAPLSAGDAPPSSRVELLDVGTLTLENGASRATLQPRRVPDVIDLVSGVLYTARTDALGGKVTLTATGGTATGGAVDVVPFTVEANAPSELRGLHLGGIEAHEGEPVMLTAAGPVDLTWQAGEAGNTDAIYVDLSNLHGTVNLRCAFADDGHGTLPASALRDDGSISVHRVRREALVRTGIERGEVRFDLARVIAFHVHAPLPH